MENNYVVNNNGVGTLKQDAGVAIPSTGFKRYSFNFIPFSPESGKTLTITFHKKVDPNDIDQYYFENESVSLIIP